MAWTTPGGSSATVLALAVLASGGARLWGATPHSPCKPLDEAVRTTIVNYARDQYSMASARVELTADDPSLLNTCYARVLVFSDNALRAALYVSPDRRFVFPDVSSLAQSRAERERLRQGALNSALSSGRAPVSGRESAPATVVMFSDFACPYCRAAAEVVRGELANPRRAANFRVVFRQFPLQMHDWAMPAARMTFCVSQQSADQFWRLHDMLFSQQPEIRSESLRPLVERFMRNADLNEGAFWKCVASSESLEAVQADIALGVMNGVNSTPTLFINGIKRVGISNADEFRSLLRESLTAGH
jgi:protein-disulfide isomerase